MMKPREKSRGQSRSRYAKIAAGAEDSAGRPEAVAHATAMDYSVEDLKKVPKDALMSLGCANPVPWARLRRGETVLDLGSGRGLDAFLAARQVGPKGRVIGVDATPEMAKRAGQTARKAEVENVEFKHAQIEHLPLDDGAVDVAISNCVMNHCPDKVRAFKEVHRVLKAGGRMCLADLVTAGEFGEPALKDEVWGEWLKVAVSKSEYLQAIERAGFQEIRVERETAFPMAESDERLKSRIISLLLTARKE